MEKVREKRMNTKGVFSSQTDEWATPQWLFDELDAEFHFDLDPCATDENHKCAEYYTKADDGLTKNWEGRTVFCNPPYGRQIVKWVRKAYEEAKKPETTVVLLVPARTDTKWFHEYIYDKAEIRFIRGRLHFNNSKQCAPFPSMVVVWRK